MNIIEVGILTRSGGSKIEAIKAFRTVFGQGLTESKHFIERCDALPAFGDSIRVRMTAEQFGNFIVTADKLATDGSLVNWSYSRPQVVNTADMPDFSRP